MVRVFMASILALLLALAPGVALARVGGGSSMGSRGSMTFSAPPRTNTAPFSAAPIERSITPREPAFTPGYGAPGYAAGPRFGGGAFTSGLLGGLIGAGLGGMLLGHGFFGGIGGLGSLIGLLIQIALLVWVGRWILRLVAGGRPAFAGFGGGFGRMAAPPRPAPRAAAPPIALGPADYAAFEALLKQMQAAWSAGDLNTLRAIATPEMVSYFSEQIAALQRRGLHNQVSNVRLLKGDLAQAWSEGAREYATVAMRFSLIDMTLNLQGEVVDGSPTEAQVVTELWTFVRAPGAPWILSAIQQAR